jgi:DNA processing protein
MNNSTHTWSLLDCLALTYLPTISAIHCFSIVEQYASFQEALHNHNKHPFLTKIGDGNIFWKSISQECYDKANQQLELCQKENIDCILYHDDVYPESLRNAPYPPFLLFCKGNVHSINSQTIVAIVGTRRCTEYGKQATEFFTEELVKNNIAIASGLANGIDTYAHSYTIKNNGITYAVIASGIDKISTNTAKYNADKIIDSGGAVFSEYKCGVGALTAYFPQRNRIVSGISDAVLVIESAIKGGALITAQFAFDQNRPLFAVPGNIFYDKNSGTNALIKRNMAAIATHPHDILSELRIPIQKQVTVAHNLNDNEEKLLKELSNGPVTIDDLSVTLSIPSSELLSTLLMMEFKGLIRQLPGKQFMSLSTTFS